MSSRSTLLRAGSRQIAVKHSYGIQPRPSRAAAVQLPAIHLADLLRRRTHRVELTGVTFERTRVAQAWSTVVAVHDALRLVPREEQYDGLWFLEREMIDTLDVPDVDMLDEAEDGRPLRWWLAPGGERMVVAVSAVLVDRSCWGMLLADFCAAYSAECTDSTFDRQRVGLEYADRCYQLVCSSLSDDSGNGGNSGELMSSVRHVSVGDDMTQVSRILPRKSEATQEERSVAIGWLSDRMRSALREFDDCLDSAQITVRQPSPSGWEGIIVGRVDDWNPVTLDVDAEIDVIDVPGLSVAGADPIVIPILDHTVPVQAFLMRRPGGTTLVSCASASRVGSLSAILAGQEPVRRLPDSRPPIRRDEKSLRPPSLRTPQRWLSGEVVRRAVCTRAAEFHAHGVRRGQIIQVILLDMPETVVNLLAALECGADVLALPAHESADQLTGVVAAGTDIVGTSFGEPTGDGDGAFIFPNGGRRLRVPLDEHIRAAACLADDLAADQVRAVAVRLSACSDDLVAVCLATAWVGAELILLPADAHAGLDLVEQSALSTVVHSSCGAHRWPVPARRLDTVDILGRQPGAGHPYDRWAVIEALGTPWTHRECTEESWVHPGATVWASGIPAPPGGRGQLAVPIALGTRYAQDPRATAQRFLPVDGGERMAIIPALAEQGDHGCRLLEFPRDRCVQDGRTVSLHSVNEAVGDGFVALVPNTEHALVVLTESADIAPGSSFLQDALVGRHINPCDLSMADALLIVEGVRSEADPAAIWASETEKRLSRDVVRPVLGTDVGSDVNFFTLGATSLQLMRIVLVTKNIFDVDVPLSEFFSSPTLHTLAQYVVVADNGGNVEAAIDAIDELTEEL